MTVVRGGIYQATDRGEADFWLVVTNNEWNSVMSEVVAIPVGDESTLRDVPSGCAGELLGRRVVAVVGAVQSVSKDVDLGPLHAIAGNAQLEWVEDELIALLHLRSLCGPVPAAPPIVGDPNAYPRWGEIYFGPRRGDPPEVKRYVIVSTNDWNAKMPRALSVRTTTSQRRAGRGFPLVQRGRAKACCGYITSIRHRAFDLRNRPVPPSHSLADMVTIAKEIADVLELSI